MLEVSCSGYYKWKSTYEQTQIREEAYENAVIEAFCKGEGTYGVQRVCAQMRIDGHTASSRKVQRYMNENGLHSVHERYCVSLTNSKNARDESVYVNLLKGKSEFKPFEAVSSDITYVPTGQGWEYECVVLEIASNTVLARATSDRIDGELVREAIRTAKSTWNIPEGVIFHSDRGSQYTAKETVALLRNLGFKPSYSRVGKPGDNAWSESFFSILKKEVVHESGFRTREEARDAIYEYIFAFYNTRRIQRRLGYLSPINWLGEYNRVNLRLTA